MQLEPGTVIDGKYRIVRLLGDGGMGAVYEARHRNLGTPVALKFLHQELAKRPGLVARFLREARVSAAIQSQHVTRVTDLDETEGSAYIVMELLGGESLQALLDRKTKLGRDLAVDVALQILLGLEAAHALGVVHRDLKPDNVFVTPSPGGPLVKILDFGIAKVRESTEYKKGLTRPGSIMGTPEYMSPEQAYAADQVDHRADLYSLGAILYEMLTGERPAYGDDAKDIVDQVTAGRVKRLTEHDATMPEGLTEVVHRALDPVYSRRFGSAGEMRLALAPFAGQLSHSGKLASTATPTQPGSKPPPEAPRTVDQAPIAAVMPGSMAPKSNAPKTLPPEPAPATSPLPAVAPAANPPTAQVAPLGVDAGRGATQEAPPLAPQQAPAPAYGPPPGAAYAATPPPTGSHRPVGAIVALVLGAAITAGIIAFFVIRQRDSGNDAPPPLATVPETQLTSDAPPSTLPPEAIGTDPTPPATRPPVRVPGPGPRPTAVPPIADAGRPTTPDAGTPKNDGGARPQFPFPIPSGFIPPGMPTTFPFPNPFQPPPSGSSTPPSKAP